MSIQGINFTPELQFKTSRSSGKGGQHVNKVSTKVELRFDIINSQLLSDEEKKRLLQKLKNRINKEGILQIASDKERSQLANKKAVIEKFYALLTKALKVPKKRIPAKPSQKAKKKRLKEKKLLSEKKKLRRKDVSDLDIE